MLQLVGLRSKINFIYDNDSLENDDVVNKPFDCIE